jgi:hypothetical protein
MAFLSSFATAAAAGLAAGACYSPELRDCTVSCESPADCSNGEICGADRFCVAPGAAGHCANDASLPPRDGAADDARPPSDGAMPDAAPLQATLVVMIEDQGVVVVANVGTCDSDPPTSGHCMFHVPLGSSQQLVAMPHMDRVFDKWTTDACKDQPSTCALVVTIATMQVSAKFRKID